MASSDAASATRMLQIDARLADWLAAHFAGGRVLLVGGDATVAAALEDAGADVVRSDISATRGGAEHSSRAVILSEDFAAAADPAERLAQAADAAGRNGLAILFRNRASAAGTIALHAGGPAAAGLAPGDVEAWVAEAGLHVVHREGLAMDPPPSIAPETEVRFRELLRQLDPEADRDWLLWNIGARSTTERAPVRGLLTVVMRHHDLARLELLDHAVFSLAAQQYRPLEIVVATQCEQLGTVERITEILDLHRTVGGYASRVVHVDAAGDARGRVTNAGLRAARGQYIAFLDDDDVVYPRHYERLVEALRCGGSAWAIARSRVARFSRGSDGALFCTVKADHPSPEEFDLGRLLRANYIPNHAFVVDRERIGRFDLSFAEDLTVCEDYALVLRMAALFRPAWVSQPGCEYRLRDDGTNVNPAAAAPAGEWPETPDTWRSAADGLNRLKDRLAILAAPAECARAAEAHVDARPLFSSLEKPPLRHRMVDAVNSALKRSMPRIHGGAKRLALRIADRQ